MASLVLDASVARSHRGRSCRVRWEAGRPRADLRRPSAVMTLASVGPEEFRRAGHELVDWVADYRLKVAGMPVRSSVAPGEVRAALPTSAPEAPEPLAALIADLDSVIVPGLTHVHTHAT